VRLTADGRRVALEVIRHHRLLELFLAEALEMPWDRVHAEAEVLEHVISEELEQLIADKLGDPTLDPHGDPIPSAELELNEPETRPLDRLGEGDGGVFVRVSDADPEMLRYLSDRGISPGDRLSVRERQPFGGPLLVSFADGACEHAIGGRLARAMRVQVDRAEVSA
jgi:DtxR family transcriptional regulator, Mn-dependent transcriptional regulator